MLFFGQAVRLQPSPALSSPPPPPPPCLQLYSAALLALALATHPPAWNRAGIERAERTEVILSDSCETERLAAVHTLLAKELANTHATAVMVVRIRW